MTPALAARLGASLYLPATRSDLLDHALGVRVPQARSLIFCTEDAVREDDLPLALAHLEQVMPNLGGQTLRFVRVRNPEVLARVLALPGAERLTGFVLPKVTARGVGAYLDVLGRGSAHQLMVTVETREAFSALEMESLRDVLLAREAPVLSIRVGGNDLLSTLGLRRTRGLHAYQTPLGPLIDRLVGLFKPYGFNLTAPVYDFTDDAETLAHEVRLDVQHGLFGKTAIHPRQIATIEAAYCVSAADFEAAQAIMRPDAPAVFRMHDMMCEPATHRSWAQAILDRAEVYGVDGIGLAQLAVQ